MRVAAPRAVLRAVATMSAMVIAAMFPAIAHAQGGACAGMQRLETRSMGSVLRVTACPPDANDVAATRAAVDAVKVEFDRLERLWSTWVTTSDVSRLNAAAGKAPVQVSAETLALLERARRGSQETQGIFDITFAPLGELWKFDTPPAQVGGQAPQAEVKVGAAEPSQEPTHLQRVPTAAEVALRLKRVGWRDLVLDAKAQTALLRRAGMAVHLGGIGKGAAVDRAVALLHGKGLTSFAIQAGGDLYCAGRNGDRPWRVGIAHPRQKGAILGYLDIQDAAFSTSGDYERFAILDGKRYHHILDTRTGWPADASQSATVYAPTATDAEVLTKASFILGGRGGVALVERLGGRAVIVDREGTVWQSKSLPLIRSGAGGVQ